MVIGVGYIEIQVSEAHSLKEKRRVVRSLLDRARNRFNASIAEVDYQDTWQMAGIAVTCVSNSSSHADQMVSEVLGYLEGNVRFGAVAYIHTELIHVD